MTFNSSPDTSFDGEKSHEVEKLLYVGMEPNLRPDLETKSVISAWYRIIPWSTNACFNGRIQENIGIALVVFLPGAIRPSKMHANEIHKSGGYQKHPMKRFASIIFLICLPIWPHAVIIASSKCIRITPTGSGRHLRLLKRESSPLFLLVAFFRRGCHSALEQPRPSTEWDQRHSDTFKPSLADEAPPTLHYHQTKKTASAAMRRKATMTTTTGST